jgi:hypothetical protein
MRTEDDATNEVLAEFIAQPGQVAGVFGARRRAGLDLDADHLAGAEGAQLRHDKGVQESAEQIGIAQDRGGVDACCGERQGWIGEVPLGSLDQPGQPVGGPGGNQVEQEQAGQQAVVGVNGPLVDACPWVPGTIVTQLVTCTTCGDWLGWEPWTPRPQSRVTASSSARAPSSRVPQVRARATRLEIAQTSISPIMG